MPRRLPLSRKGRHAIVGAVVAEGDQVSVQLLDRPLLLARFRRLLTQHVRQLVGERVKPARPIGVANRGSTLSERRYLRTVLRDSPCVAQSPGSRIVADIASVG